YNDSNSTCKTNNEWIRNKFQKISKPCKPHSYEHNSRHKCGNDQSIDSMILNNRINNNDKRTRRSSDLNPTSTQNRNNQSSNYRSDNSFLRRYSRGNCKSNRQRQCNNSYYQSRHQILLNLFATYPLF